jgi:hypothetical protein
MNLTGMQADQQPTKPIINIALLNQTIFKRALTGKQNQKWGIAGIRNVSLKQPLWVWVAC